MYGTHVSLLKKYKSTCPERPNQTIMPSPMSELQDEHKQMKVQR